MSGLVSSSAGESPLPAVTLFVNPPPTFASIILSATATETGVPVTIRDSVLGGTGNYSYQDLGLPQGCQSEDVPVLTCDPTEVGSFNVGIAAIDSVGVKAFETEPLVVGPHPFVQAVLASRATLDVGLATELSVVAGGGVGPLTFAYSGLPDGCASSNTTGLSCAPSANGTFTVQVSASDQFGYSASGSVRFTVHPRLVAPTFTANSSSVHLGDNVSFTLSVSGGMAPYRYIYTALPTGCSTLNDSAIQCDPRATGHFVVRVTVTDDFGESVTDNTTLTVDLRTGLVTNPGPGIGGWVVRSALAGGHASRRRRRGRFDGRDRLRPPAQPEVRVRGASDRRPTPRRRARTGRRIRPVRRPDSPAVRLRPDRTAFVRSEGGFMHGAFPDRPRERWTSEPASEISPHPIPGRTAERTPPPGR